MQQVSEESSGAVPRLHGLDHAAMRWGISVWTARLYAHKGLFPTVKLGRRRLVSEETIARVAREGLPRAQE